MNDNVFLFDENETKDEDYINEHNIIHRANNIQESEDNHPKIYDINNLINRDIIRENILLSTNDIKKSHDDTAHLSHENKTVIFDLSLNNLGGMTYKKNVIGFRLNECIFTTPFYNIKFNINDTIKITTYRYQAMNEGGILQKKTDINLTIPEGYYNTHLLIHTINNHTNNIIVTEPKYIKLEYSTPLMTLTKGSSTDEIFIIKSSQLLQDLGFVDYEQKYNGMTVDGTENILKDQTAAEGTHYPNWTTIVSKTHISLIIGTYLDIVVDEVPYGACKHNPHGLNIIHRLPLLTENTSSIVYYKSNFLDYNLQYLFPPINISQLTIHLYMDGEELKMDNLTISFEFELTILNK